MLKVNYIYQKKKEIYRFLYHFLVKNKQTCLQSTVYDILVAYYHCLIIAVPRMINIEIGHKAELKFSVMICNF